MALTFGDDGIRLSLREWVNTGLMTFFFLVTGALIAALYSHDLDLTALAWGAAFVAMIAAMRALGVRSSIPCVLLGVAAWVALHESGVEPVVLGLALGLLFGARPVGRPELHRAAERFRRFREQPTPQLERSARHGLRAAIPPNERLLALYHPWTSYAIVPLFALANAGIAIDGELLRRAAGSPVTIGVLVGLLSGKPLGTFGTPLAVTRLSRGRLRPPVGWAAVISAGTSTGVGFTMSLLVACLAFTGAGLDEAKLGLLGAAALAPTTSIRPVITSAGRSMRRSPSWSTATSNARTAGERNPMSASCCATSPT